MVNVPSPQCQTRTDDAEDLGQLLRRVRERSLDAEHDIIEMFNYRRKELAEWKQAASVEAGLRREFAARIEELEAALRFIEANDRMWTSPEYEKGNEVLERGPHNIRIRGSYGERANFVLKRGALPRTGDPARTEQERGK